MIWRGGRYELRLVDNRPVFAFSFLCSVFAPEDDRERSWFLRCRIGWLKLEAVRWR